MSVVKIFVYGTLKIGGRFAELYKDRFDPERLDVVKGSISGKLFNLGSFPGVKLSDKGKVFGEVHTFENPDKIMPVMDRIEGYNEERVDNLFNRVETEVTLESGGTETALMYVFASGTDGYEEIEDGVWKI